MTCILAREKHKHDTMYQGALGCLDPKTGKIVYYPLAPEYNDDTVQLNFSGLRHDVDGKIWTKTVGTQHIFRVDLKTGKWERFHPADFLPKETAPSGRAGSTLANGMRTSGLARAASAISSLGIGGMLLRSSQSTVNRTAAMFRSR